MVPAVFRLVAHYLNQLRHRVFDIYYHNLTKDINAMFVQNTLL